MLKRMVYSKIILFLCKLFFGLIYEKKHMKGKYFEEKRMGWYWALVGLPRKVIGTHRKIPWPVGKNTIISRAENIDFDPDSINVFQSPGSYFQCHDGKIFIGKNVHIAPNCGIITTNHKNDNPDLHEPGKDIIIGDNCWIGMNSVILPGVKLGNNTIVGAGSVVTKSFPDGYVVIGGTPAKKIKLIEARA
ncbi:acyltransferase [Fictibacillus aquaticus]|uniref:Acyltransferase n=1 Tax=Fictibacillus aquaticus TaxID=2021314 RepID=A0A235F8H6_9BACL|nr:acyltransferase [Fictibacillus aquaticus]OYD57610.1 acyltransferase [Fictibacillus aquaticus]